VKSLKTLNNPSSILIVMNMDQSKNIQALQNPAHKRARIRAIVVPSVIFLALALAFTACSNKAETTSTTPGLAPIPVKVASISQIDAQRPINIGGLLATENEARLSFKTGGIIQRIHVKVGDPVRKGQKLATLDLTEVSAGVGQAQLALEKAQRDYTRAKALYEDSVATLEMFQNAKTALDFATKTVEAAKFNESHSAIYATSDGSVLAKIMNEGEMAGPGMPVLALSTTSRQSQWVLRAGLSDKEWSLLQVGDSASVTIDAYPDRVFKGKVSGKSQGADPYSGSFQIEVEIELGDVKPAAGLFGQATIYPHAQGKYWLLPYEAVLEANGNDAFVFVTNDRKTATKVPVKVAYLDAKSIAVSAGLDGHQEVITTGSAYLTDKSPITIAQ
jgi:RND family efflux transporter MFP subunit